MRNVIRSVVLGVVGSSLASAPGAIHYFVSNPTNNSGDFQAHGASRGLVVNTSLDFSTHPDGNLVNTFFQAALGVTLETSGSVSVQTGNGSLFPNVPGGPGEGLLPEPATYLHTGFGALTTVDFMFDQPIAAFGVMTADMFRWGAASPAATIEAFDSSGTSLGSTPSINESFEFDYVYFMGVADDDARISRVRFSNFGVSGDSIYLTQAWFARATRCTCPADLDDGTSTGTCDGGVTIDDLLYYLGLFADGSVRADLDDGTATGTPDGGVTIDDLLYFLDHFAAGC